MKTVRKPTYNISVIFKRLNVAIYLLFCVKVLTNDYIFANTVQERLFRRRPELSHENNVRIQPRYLCLILNNCYFNNKSKLIWILSVYKNSVTDIDISKRSICTHKCNADFLMG